jgi:hypothetical protein
MLGLVSSRALGLFSNSTALNSFRDKLCPIAARALSHIPKPTHRQIRHATPLLFIGLFYLMQKLCYPIFLKIDLEYNRANKLSDFIKSITAPIIKLSVLTVFTETIRRYLPINIQNKVNFVCAVSLSYALYKSQIKVFEIQQSQRRETQIAPSSNTPRRPEQAAEEEDTETLYPGELEALMAPFYRRQQELARIYEIRMGYVRETADAERTRQLALAKGYKSHALARRIKSRKATGPDDYMLGFLPPMDILSYTATCKSTRDFSIRSFLVVSCHLSCIVSYPNGFLKFIKIATDQKIPISVIPLSQVDTCTVKHGILLIKDLTMFIVFVKNDLDPREKFIVVKKWGSDIRYKPAISIESFTNYIKDERKIYYGVSSGKETTYQYDHDFIYSLLADDKTIDSFTIIREEMPRLESTSSSLVCGAGAASGVVGEPEISAEEITQLWNNIQRKLAILNRFMRSKNAIDPSFQETENTLSLAIKQTALTYKASVKQELNSFLAKIEEHIRALSGQSGVRVAD